MLTRTQAGTTQGFTYDLAERVLTTTRDGVLQATHVYDGNGLRTRTSKPVPGAPAPNRDLRFQIYTPSGVFQWENDIECSRLRSRGVNYVRLAGSLLAKVVANSTLTQAECYPGTSNSEQQTLSLNPFRNPFRNPFAGATEVVAGSTEGEAPTAPTSTTTYSIVYVHTDALGSPVAETNINGTVIPGSRTQYEPYGKPLTTPREGAPSYTGHQYDTSTGLIYAQQRYYDPALGRFLSTDPMAVDMGSAGNWNRYAYAQNNPYVFVDPDGRCGTRVEGASAHNCKSFDVAFKEWRNQEAKKIFLPFAGPLGGAIESAEAVLKGDAKELSIAVVTTVPWGKLLKFLRIGALAGRGVPRLVAPVMHDHHLMPRQFKGFFAKRGIDIDAHTVSLGERSHLAGVHGKGLGNMPGGWNQEWAGWISENPNASAKDIYQHLGTMMDRYKINDLPIHPFGQ